MRLVGGLVDQVAGSNAKDSEGVVDSLQKEHR